MKSVFPSANRARLKGSGKAEAVTERNFLPGQENTSGRPLISMPYLRKSVGKARKKLKGGGADIGAPFLLPEAGWTGRPNLA